jgi:hypothetical protein
VNPQAQTQLTQLHFNLGARGYSREGGYGSAQPCNRFPEMAHVPYGLSSVKNFVVEPFHKKIKEELLSLKLKTHFSFDSLATFLKCDVG